MQLKSSVDAIARCIKETYPSAELATYGSQATGLQLPDSDVDLVLLNMNLPHPKINAQGIRYNHTDKRRVVHALTKISASLQANTVVRSAVVIPGASIPIIKMEDLHGRGVDLTIGTRNGLDAVPAIEKLKAEYPPMRPLCLVMKAFLREKGLNDVFTGGIGSYMLVNMLVAHLQTAESSGAADLGVLLRGFFKLFGEKFDYSKVRSAARPCLVSLSNVCRGSSRGYEGGGLNCAPCVCLRLPSCACVCLHCISRTLSASLRAA